MGIIGSGPVGRGLATLAARAGYPAILGTGNPSASTLKDLDERVSVGSFADAAGSRLVVLAVRHCASRDIVTRLRTELKGKVVIDCDNAFIPADRRAADFQPGQTEASWLAQLLPDSFIVRAFSHINWDLLVSSAAREPGAWAAGYALDDEPDKHSEAADAVVKFIGDIGYVPVRVGTLAESGALDPQGILWAKMFTPEAMRRTLGLPDAAEAG